MRVTQLLRCTIIVVLSKFKEAFTFVQRDARAQFGANHLLLNRDGSTATVQQIRVVRETIDGAIVDRRIFQLVRARFAFPGGRKNSRGEKRMRPCIPSYGRNKARYDSRFLFS